MRKATRVIITCAANGSIHTPTMSQYLPATLDEIAADANGAAEAHSAMIHLRARDPETGQANRDPDLSRLYADR
ncbi:MAG: hypothetical protein EOO77_22320 [Oxalobacteraceae bacterium]|nr:MAG: hypothetical protein EOO77_22320 [Oxalobacteraceae bacterium]